MENKDKKGWRKLKDLIQSLKPTAFEKFTATLMELFLETPFVVARSGDQPSGDARSLTGEVSIQAKNYSDETSFKDNEIEGDIHRVNRTLQDLQVYILAVSRDAAQRRDRWDAVENETGLDIVVLDLTDDLSDLGALSVTFWEDLCAFFDSSDTSQQFLNWVEREKNKPETTEKISELRDKLKYQIQTQESVRKDAEKRLQVRFSETKGFNPIDLSRAIARKSLESKISEWWETGESPICCLEGEEGHGKTWLAAKWIDSIREKENTLIFWLDSKNWASAQSISDLFRAYFSSIYPPHKQQKITKLQNKAAKIWRRMLVVLDGVNERNAIKAAQRILREYSNFESEWKDRIRFLLTTRPLDAYPNFYNYLWNKCDKISVDPFNDSELQKALCQQRLQPDDLPDPLKDIARIPRYFQRCVELRDKLGSLDVVTKEMILWADLLNKIKTDPQIREKIEWSSVKDAQSGLAKLARKVEWPNVNDTPQASSKLLTNCFSIDYNKIRRDLAEQRITLSSDKNEAELSKDHIILGWALYLANLFDCRKFTGIEDAAEGFQNALEPIPSEDLRTEALFVALLLSVISPPNISQDQLSQKRAALMLAWFYSPNAQITDERLSFWTEKDPDAYGQVVEFEFRDHKSFNFEDTLIAPLAKTWLNHKGDLSRLASRLKEWLSPADTTDNGTENVNHISAEGDPFPTMGYTQNLLSAAAISILSQRPEPQFLEKLARCYQNLEIHEQFREDIGRLMRWGYTEHVLKHLEDLCSLAKQAQDDVLLNGIYGLSTAVQVANLPEILKRPPSEEDIKRRALAEERRRRFKPLVDRIRDQERLLTSASPADNVKRSYHGLGYLAVRTDLPDLIEPDKNGIKNVLHDIAANAKLDQGAARSREDSCIENLLPWVAKYDPENYAELACNLKLNALNQEWAQFKLSSIQGIIFHPEDRKKIAEAILGMQQRLLQDIQVDASSSDATHLTSLLTETLLFSASEAQLTDWFEFLSSHESLRKSAFTPLQRVLIDELLPEAIVKLAQQKLETSQFSADVESEKITEEDFWCWIRLCSFDNDETTVAWAFENLKRSASDLRTMTYCFLEKATSDPNRFLSEILADEDVRKHLFLKDGRFFSPPIYEGENSHAYEDLMSVLPQEVVGSFLCSSERRADLSRWGKEFMERMCSILQGDEAINEELRFTVNRKVLQTWATQDKTDFLQLAPEYFDLLSKSRWYCPGLDHFMDDLLCLLLRFEPAKAMQYYRQSNAKGATRIFSSYRGVRTFIAQLWQVEDCKSPKHSELRRTMLEECLNDEDIMFMTLAALAGEGEEELWDLVTQEYLESPYAKERNLAVSILPWFGTCEAIEQLERLKLDDQSQWVRDHARWAYKVAQQERSCREVYRDALHTRDLFRISAVCEQIKPALSSTAQWWPREIEKEEGFHEESQDIDPKLAALLSRFWYRWGNTLRTSRNNSEVFGRKLYEYCRGEKLLAFSTPRIAPWWKPSSD